MLADAVAHDADEAQSHADQAAAQIVNGEQRRIRRLRQEGSDDEQADGSDHQRRGHIVRHVRLHSGGYLLRILAEEHQQGDHRGQRAQLHAPEDARTALHPEEIEEIHARVAAQQHTGRIADHGRRALKI